MSILKALCAGLYLVSVAVVLPVGANASEPQPILLWPNGAPGSEGKTGPESVKLTPQGEHIISNIHYPSLTPYLPSRSKATTTAVIVVPGGGHRELWMDHEGYRVGRWLSERGIAAFVLKYRLALEPGSTYTIEGTELADVQRAIQLVKSREAEWRLNGDLVGVMGFSAGGALAALAGTHFEAGRPDAADPIDRLDSRPAFMALIYPSIPIGLTIPKETPAAFLLCGEDDSEAISQGVPELYLALKREQVSTELHILAGAGHGFGVRVTNPRQVANWTTLFYDWLDARGFLHRN